MLAKAYVITHEQSLICSWSDIVSLDSTVVADCSTNDYANGIKSTTGRYLTIFSPSDQKNHSTLTADHSFVTVQSFTNTQECKICFRKKTDIFRKV